MSNHFQGPNQFDDDSVWNELNHEETREMHQHHIKNSHLSHDAAAKIGSVPIFRHFPANGSLGHTTLHSTLPKIHQALGSVANTVTTATHKIKKAVDSHDGAYYGPYRQSDQAVQNSHASAAAEFGLHPQTGEIHDIADMNICHGSPEEPLLSSNDHHNNFLENNGGGPKFVLLDRFRLAPSRDGWGAVANLDLFFASLYNYYYHRGLVPIIGKGVVELVSLFFTLWLSIFLFVYLDWKELFNCRDEDTCKAYLSDYILDRPFQQRGLIWRLGIFIYIILYTLYGAFSISSFVKTVRDALESKYVFEDKLGISTQKLEGGAVEWYDIVQKIVALQSSGEYRIAIHDEDVKDELNVAQRIMRRENFMIAFFNKSLLDLSIPLPWNRSGKSKLKFYSKTLEWCIYYSILSYMFNHKYQIRPSFCTDVRSLQKRFIFCGVGHMLFTPFLLFFMMLHYFLQNMYDLRSSRQYLGPREWSSIARWKFREFNELPHVFERRMDPSYKAAEDYLKLFMPSSLLNSIGRIIVFLSGSLGAVCIALAAINDSILLHVKIWNWNLVWYLGILGAVYSAGKGLIPNGSGDHKGHHNRFAEMDDALGLVASHTHYYPDFWKKRGWDHIIRSEFTDLYQYKVQLFFMEIISIIVAPIVLVLSLPSCADDICAFVRTVKIEIPGSGDHCGFVTFDFDLFEDSNWEGDVDEYDSETPAVRRGSNVPTSLSSLNSNRTAIYTKLNEQSRPKSIHGKMEKSFFNFKTVNPLWKCSSGNALRLVGRMEAFEKQQAQEAVALARERQLYTAAAVRELERLQNMPLSNNEYPFSEKIHEDYVMGPVSLGSQATTNKILVDTLPKTDPNHYDDSSMPTSFSGDPNISSHGISKLALNKSIFDAGVSLLDASRLEHSIPSMSYLRTTIGGSDSQGDILQRQYMLLENYHERKLSRP